MLDIEKPRKSHNKKTEWGTRDNFAKAAKKASKRVKWESDDESEWQDEVRDALDGVKD